jgi:DNA polymerase-3 subunit epsilon
MKLFFTDVETTGIDPCKHAVIQVAGQIVINGEVRERFDYRVRPMDGDVIDEEALRVNGVKREDLMHFAPPREAYARLTQILGRYIDKYSRTDKFFFVGYNGRFDYDFLRQFFEKVGDRYFGSWFWVPAIDVMTIAGFVLAGERQNLPNFRLATVAAYFGVKPSGDLHDAQTDIEMTRQVFDILAKRMGMAALA